MIAAFPLGRCHADDGLKSTEEGRLVREPRLHPYLRSTGVGLAEQLLGMFHAIGVDEFAERTVAQVVDTSRQDIAVAACCHCHIGYFESAVQVKTLFLHQLANALQQLVICNAARWCHGGSQLFRFVGLVSLFLQVILALCSPSRANNMVHDNCS